MVIERYTDPEVVAAIAAGARRAYRQAAEIVAQHAATLVASVGQALSDAEWMQLLGDASDAYGDAYLDASIATGIELGILPPDSAVETAMANSELSLAELAATTRDLLNRFLAETAHEHLDFVELRRRLLDEPQSPFAPWKAEAFARTATTQAVNAGYFAAFKRAGVPAMSWITQRDDKVRDAHIAVDHDVVPLGTPFMMGDHEAWYPGDPSLPIGLRINCRCMLGWVDGYEIRRAVDARFRALYERARTLGIEGRSKMSKPELQREVIKTMCLQGLAAGTDCPDQFERMNMTALLNHARIADISGRWRMRRPELVEAVAFAYRQPRPDGLVFSTMVDMSLQGEAVALARGEEISVPKARVADVVASLADQPDPIDLTNVRTTAFLFHTVTMNERARDDMPQIPEEHLDEFARFLESRGVTLTAETVAPDDLWPTQNQLDAVKTGGMIRAIRDGTFQPEHPAFTSKSGQILDGHHRWAARTALHLSGDDQSMDIIRADVDTDKLVLLGHEYADRNGIDTKTHGMAFDPNQPRHPKGSVVGGRWRPAYDPSGQPHRYWGPAERPWIYDDEAQASWQAERDLIATHEKERMVHRPANREERERYTHLHGKGIDALFTGPAPTTTVPFPTATRKKGERLYDREIVADRLSHDIVLTNFDPRTLVATQQGLTRSGVEYYTGAEYRSTGTTFADQDQRGNRWPVVYRNPNSGELMILSGHHRAAAALVQGRNLEAVFIDPRIRIIRGRSVTSPPP